MATRPERLCATTSAFIMSTVRARTHTHMHTRNREPVQFGAPINGCDNRAQQSTIVWRPVCVLMVIDLIGERGWSVLVPAEYRIGPGSPVGLYTSMGC